MEYIIGLLVVLGVLIFVHELGHFLAARAMGVAVIRFSFGLGPKTPLAVKWGETEYCISWIPFGGYVKMAGMEDEGASAGLEGGADPEIAAVPPERHLENKSRPARALIFSAGVAMNLLFAVFAYAVIAWRYGTPQVDTVMVGDIAAADLPLGAGNVASLKPGDRIIRVGGDTVTTWEQIVLGLYAAPDGPVAIEVAGRDEPVLVEVPKSRRGDRQALIRAIEPGVEPVIGDIVPGQPADSAGIRPGDRIITAGGDTVASWQRLVRVIEANPGRPVVMTVQRGGAIESLTVTPRPTRVPGEDSALTVGKVGAGPFIATQRYGLGASMTYGVQATGAAAGEVLFTLKGLILGRLSPRDLGGVILIGQLSGQAARRGIRALLDLMALLSVNLAVLNLLPIPVLDGGHLLFLGIEAVRRKPLSVEARQRWMSIGLVLVLLLMVLALYNDVARLIQ